VRRGGRRARLVAILGATVLTGLPSAALAEPTIRPISRGISPGAGPAGIATGPDGNLWFAENSANAYARMTTTGMVTEFLGRLNLPSRPGDIVSGPDGNLWLTEIFGGKVARIHTDGSVTEFQQGITADPTQITVGSDGNLWFTEASGNLIGRITPEGDVREFGSGIAPMSGPFDIVTAPDGALWFTQTLTTSLTRMTTRGEVTTTIDLAPSTPGGLAVGPDGNLWVALSAPAGIARVTEDGDVQVFRAGLRPGSGPFHILAGPDGNLWFTEQFARGLGRITPEGGVTLFRGFRGRNTTFALALGPDFNLYVTEENGNRVLQIDFTPRAVTGGARAGSDSAAVRGRITANGVPTRYRVEYGATRRYGSSTASVSAGQAIDAVRVSAVLIGLRPGKRYHYRLVAISDSGIRAGADRVLRTRPR